MPKTHSSEPANPERLEAYLRDMRLLHPEYDLPLFDFWDPGVVDDMTAVRQVRSNPDAYDARLGPFAVTYEAGDFIPVKLEIRDAATGRRLRQDGEDDLAILHRLAEKCRTTSIPPSVE